MLEEVAVAEVAANARVHVALSVQPWGGKPGVIARFFKLCELCVVCIYTGGVVVGDWTNTFVSAALLNEHSTYDRA